MSIGKQERATNSFLKSRKHSNIFKKSKKWFKLKIDIGNVLWRKDSYRSSISGNNIVTIKNNGEFASTNKYIYGFERNENSEILIFAQKKEGLLLNDDINEKYSFKIFFDVGLEIRAEKKQVFLYENRNDIKFELFDNFLAPNAPENKYKNGKIECDFELLYFLRITRDMVEFPEILNIHQVKCMLTIMRCLH
ncbi:hypothetical protein CWI37_0371p0010, partial [Hamiltosporidium tvaerminnensis]